MNIIKKTRLSKNIDVKCMSLQLKVSESEYLDIEDNFYDRNAFIVIQICMILGLDFSKI